MFAKGPAAASIGSVFVANREKLVESLHANGVTSGVVFLRGGRSSTRADSDHEPIFRQESYFWYLTGAKEPDFSLMIRVRDGSSTLFVPRLPPSYATVMGHIRTLEDHRAQHAVEEAAYEDDVEDCILKILNEESSNSNNGTSPKVYVMFGRNSDSGIMFHTPTFENAELTASTDFSALFPVLAECRVIKSTAELALMRHVTQVTSFAHAYVMRNVKPGMMEYQGESLFRHYCFYNYGCRLVGYTPICGCGPNAAILHCGHSGEPNSRQTESGDMCLFDMGAEYCGYGSDVTCSFPINGNFTPNQRAIYNAVLAAQVVVYNMIKPGVSWVECHKAAEKEILRHLVDLGVVVIGDRTIDDLVDMRLGAVFMPHGLGHLIGIDTHDVGGYLDGHPKRIGQPGLKSLRTARRLKEGMTLTVEPGCYFINHLLDEALTETSLLEAHLNGDKIKEFRGFGGVRLEDVIHVTSSSCVNFTCCPQTVEEVSHVCSGGNWPPVDDKAPELRRTGLTQTAPMSAPLSL